MSATTRSGIKTSDDGSSYIPSSTRADGSTRKAIKVRPGYRPPEDVDTYKSQKADAWKSRGSGGIPGAENGLEASVSIEAKSKNAKRREAARKRKELEAEGESEATNRDEAHHGINTGIDNLALGSNRGAVQAADDAQADEIENERQRKIRNLLKKLRGVHELRDKKSAGEKLSHEQLVKVGKEDELIRDLQKLKYDISQLNET